VNSDFGIMVELASFKSYFDDVHSDYINSFLPAATIEAGRTACTHTKFVFRVKKGVYLIHPEAIKSHIEKNSVGDREK